MKARSKLADDSIVDIPDDDTFIGYLTWYTVGQQLVEKGKLKEFLQKSNLIKFMPSGIRLDDAFKRATTDLERILNRRSTSTQYFLREVHADETYIQRNLIKEEVLLDKGTVKYSEDEVILLFSKDNGEISVTAKSESEQANEIIKLVKELFDQYKSSYESRNIRTLVLNILRSMYPISLRQAGGIYFVSKKYEEKLSSLDEFVSTLDDSEMYLIPLIKTNDTLKVIRKNAKRLLNDCFLKVTEAFNNTEATFSQIGHVVTDVERIKRIFADNDVILRDSSHDETFNTINEMVKEIEKKRQRNRKKQVM